MNAMSLALPALLSFGLASACTSATQGADNHATTNQPATTAAPTDDDVLAAPVRPLLKRTCGLPDACAAACDRGDGSACTQLGVMHLFGEPYSPPARSADAAAGLLARACELGDAEGCATAAMHYSGILGGPRDEARSAAFLKQAEETGDRACLAGDALACWEIAPHPNGMSTSPMQVSAVDIDRWRRACAAGVAEACGAYAFHLSNPSPELSARLAARGLALHEAACEQGHEPGCVTAALRLQDAGQGDRARAMWDRRRAILTAQCDARIASSCNVLSMIYDPGHSDQGLPKDLALAQTWAQRACAAEPKIDCNAGFCRRAVELGAACPPP